MEHQERNDQELGLDSSEDRGWSSYLCYLYKIVSTKMLPYFYETLPPLQSLERNPGCIKLFDMSNWALPKFFLTIYYNWMEQIGSWR